MANIDLTKYGIAVVVGAVDEALERNDATHGRIEVTKKWSNYFRAGAVLLGAVMTAMGPAKYQGWAETMGVAATPLLTKSVAQTLMKKEGTATSTAMFRARRVEAQARDWAITPPSNGEYRPM